MCRGFRLVLILTTFFSGSAFAGMPHCTARLIHHEWRPWLALAGNTTRPRAVKVLRRHLQVSHNLLMRSHLDGQTRKLKNQVLDSLRDFDLHDLYELLPDAEEPWRSLTLRGVKNEQAYDIRQVGPAAFDDPLKSLGDMAASVGMRPRIKPDSGPGGDVYEIRQRLRTDTGQVQWKSVLKAARLGLATLAKPYRIAAPERRRARVEKMNPGLPDSDQALLAQLATAFPSTWKWYASIGAVTSWRMHDSPKPGLHHMQVTLQLDKEELNTRYPEVARYLDQVGDFISARLRIVNHEGRWLSARLDTRDRKLTVDGWVAGGRLVPSRDGKPVVSHEGKGPLPSEFAWTTEARLHLRALGLNVRIRQLSSRWHYHYQDAKARFLTALSEQPEVEVSGHFLGFVPASWVEFLLPTNIEDGVHDFMHTLIRSNDGQGAKLKIVYGPGQTGASTLRETVDANALDNFVVHVGLGMLNGRVLADEKEARGLRRISNDALQAFGADLNRLSRAVPVIEGSKPQADGDCSERGGGL